jgi:membrane protease YdiL (CAAX protease family)
VDTYYEAPMTASPLEFPPIASPRHTAILAAIFLVLAIGGAFLRRDAAAGPSGPHVTLVPLYASLIAAEWGLVYYVWRGAIRHRIGFLAFIGGRWARPGISEELAFRGYFQRQLRAMTGSVAAALGLQAVLFGVSHGYQGLGPCLRITTYGLLFGLLVE